MTVTVSLSEYLASLDLSVQQAQEFIFSHVENPVVILTIAVQYGVTLDMLGELVGYSPDDVAAFFVSHDLDPTPLEGGVPGPGDAFVPPVLEPLANLWTLNAHTGDLSNASLHA